VLGCKVEVGCEDVLISAFFKRTLVIVVVGSAVGFTPCGIKVVVKVTLSLIRNSTVGAITTSVVVE